MRLMATIWRWAGGLATGLFVCAYITTLVVHNIAGIADAESSGPGSFSKRLLTATGTTQRWNMFAPNVGTVSYSPIVVLVFRDGKRLALHSDVEPELPGWAGPDVLPNDATGEVRNYSWRFHLADGRIRKYESRAASYASEWWRVRSVYARWKATEWLKSNPGQRERLLRIELWRCAIRHPGYGNALHCESVEILPLSPYAEKERWPIPIDSTYMPYWS